MANPIDPDATPQPAPASAQPTAPPVSATPPAPIETQNAAPPSQIPQQETPQAPPISDATRANLEHSALVGHGFKALLSSLGGTTTQYQQTPDGPKAVQVKNSGGDFFRNILAGAIMGAGAGGGDKSQGGFWGGASRGAAAETQNFKSQDEQRQQQAQLQFTNKQAADKAAREATGFETEQKVRNAQIAQANAETLRTNLLTQGSSFDLHQKVADADRDRISTYTQAGVKPVFEDIPESQMTDVFKNRPGASTLDWRHTGVKTVSDPNDPTAPPHYEYTLSAYDPQQPLPLSKGTVAQWEKDGLFKYHPEYKDIATAGKNLTVGQFTALDRQAQNYAGQQLAQTKDDLETEHLKAQIGEVKASTNEHFTQAALANLGIQEKRTAIAEKKAADTAWEHLAAVGDDPDKLTDSHDKIALAKVAAPAMAETLAAIKDAQANTQDKDAQDSLPGLWGRYNTLTKLASLARAPTPSVQPVTFINPQGQQVIATTQEQVDKATKLGYKKAGSPEPEDPNSASAGFKKGVSNLPSFPNMPVFPTISQ